MNDSSDTVDKVDAPATDNAADKDVGNDVGDASDTGAAPEKVVGVQRAELLTSDEAEAVSHAVNSLQAHWVARDDFALHTLGAAAYLDAPTDETLARFGIEAPERDAYATSIADGNRLLMQHFNTVYTSVIDTLTHLLDAEVMYADGKALPGFHVFGDHAHYASPGSHTAHFDRQYESLAWDCDIAVGSVNTVSFTVPVKLPSAGAGLLLWGVELEAVLAAGPEAAAETIRAAPRWREHYTVGELVLHPGHMLHRIAPWRSEPGDQRITLQGHALQIDGCWQVYW